MFQCSLRETKQLAVLVSYYNPANAGIFVQAVRYRVIRKPIWLPMAKSKLFRISPRPVIPSEDVAELKRLHNNYRTQMKTITRFLKDELIREEQTLASATSEESLKEEALEFERCMKENDMWNADVAIVRNKRLEKNAMLREEKMLELMAEREERSQQNLKIAEEKVRIYKGIEFISRETLDEAIEKSLSDVVDYNYAIDLNGNIYPGREGDKPLPIHEELNQAEATS